MTIDGDFVRTVTFVKHTSKCDSIFNGWMKYSARPNVSGSCIANGDV